jgi:hypothetical protein
MPDWCAWRRAGPAGHHWLRIYSARLGHLFRYLPEQPGYHNRLKAAGYGDRSPGRAGLDRAPGGRNETGRWWRRHGEY